MGVVDLRRQRQQFATRSLDGVLDNIAISDAAVVAATAIPEPASLVLLGLGLIGLCASRRKSA